MKATIKYGIFKRRVTLREGDIKGLPPYLLHGLVTTDPAGRAFHNDHGTFYVGRGPSDENPLGLNARFIGIDKDGAPVDWTAQFYGYVQEVEDGPYRGAKYVPGWNIAAVILGHPDFWAVLPDEQSAYGRAFYSDMPVGTDIRPALRDQGYGV